MYVAVGFQWELFESCRWAGPDSTTVLVFPTLRGVSVSG